MAATGTNNTQYPSELCLVPVATGAKRYQTDRCRLANRIIEQFAPYKANDDISMADPCMVS